MHETLAPSEHVRGEQLSARRLFEPAYRSRHGCDFARNHGKCWTVGHVVHIESACDPVRQVRCGERGSSAITVMNVAASAGSGIADAATSGAGRAAASGGVGGSTLTATAGTNVAGSGGAPGAGASAGSSGAMLSTAGTASGTGGVGMAETTTSEPACATKPLGAGDHTYMIKSANGLEYSYILSCPKQSTKPSTRSCSCIGTL